MNKLLLVSLVLICACASQKQSTTTKINTKQHSNVLRYDNSFVLYQVSKDPNYGHSPQHPVEVGGAENSEGPLNERRYLNALAGPNGEVVSYFRAGSCCPIKSDKAIIGDAVMLDLYKVSWENAKDTLDIYINMYDSSTLKAPKGFSVRN